MSRYDDEYIFRLATVNDIEDIMAFYDAYWPGNKIMGKDRRYVEWQFGLKDSDAICVLLALSKLDGDIIGAKGFVSGSPVLEGADIWGCSILINSNRALPMLGMELDRRARTIIPYRTHLTLGMRSNTLALAQTVFGKKTGRLAHYYRINPNIDEYRLALVNNTNSSCKCISRGNAARIRLYDNADWMEQSYGGGDPDAIPFKSKWYIRHHYYEHPIYHYDVYGIERNSVCDALFVTRTIEHKGASALRVVDYIGDRSVLSSVGTGWCDILTASGAEYMDFYAYGFDDSVLSKIGFSRRTDEDTNIIPNWYEPFVRENKDIAYGLETDDDVILCKADGDMDKPNWGYYPEV
ncbi:MAG: hypothetical protein VZQ83_00600 [Eubacterium sp.]|nr:hypothetical protein [Eubacterium sp.]